MLRARLLAPLLVSLCSGCAIRGTVHLSRAEQAILRLEPVDAETWAPYSATMARQYLLKCRSEWAQADYGDAEMLSAQVQEWVDRAEEEAVANKAKGTLPDIPPDWVDPVELNGGPIAASADEPEAATTPAPMTQPARAPLPPAAPTTAPPPPPQPAPWGGGQ
jgi:hypothetical protein